MRKHLYYSLLSERVVQENVSKIFNFYLVGLYQSNKKTQDSISSIFESLQSRIQYPRKNNLIFLEYELKDDTLLLFQTWLEFSLVQWFVGLFVEFPKVHIWESTEGAKFNFWPRSLFCMFTYWNAGHSCTVNTSVNFSLCACCFLFHQHIASPVVLYIVTFCQIIAPM